MYNIPEERRTHLHSGGHLKSRKSSCVIASEPLVFTQYHVQKKVQKKEAKFALEHTMKAKRGSKDICLLFL